MKDPFLKPHESLGRYEILAELARGAMGVVYKARDPLIDRLVAIKTVGLGLSDAETEAFERRFFREARSAGRLNHPNIVTIHDVGKTGDIAYIAMEFLDGRSLREILDSGVVLPLPRIADITAQIADGLAYAHRHQVVHRDVKPANVMVLADGKVKITDFGIALLPTGTRTLSGNVFGSPRYTSPEQVMGRPVDGRSDVFSLGAVLYEMLTGLPPFTGGDLNSILTQVLSEPTAPPSSRNRNIPRAFDHVVGKALAKDPADRYQDALEMAVDLRNFEALESASTAPAPLPSLEHPTLGSGKFVAPRVAAGAVMAGAAAAKRGNHRDASLLRSRHIQVTAAVSLAVIAMVVVWSLSSRTPPADETSPKAASSLRTSVATVQDDPPVAEPAPAADTVAGASTAGSSSATTAAMAGVASSAPMVATPVAPMTPSSDSSAVGLQSNAAPAAKVTPRQAKPTGRVAFAIAPWGEIWVDGRRRGLAPPLQELRVAPGKHVVEIRNSTFQPYRETVDVAADGIARIKHKFP